MASAREATEIKIDDTIHTIQEHKVKFITHPVPECQISGYRSGKQGLMYAVTKDGSVWSQWFNKRKKEWRGMWLKPRIHTKGYLQVGIGRYNILVHRLVAEAWVEGKTKDKYEINHKNHDKRDNRAENLEWCDRNYNMIHAYNQK